MSKPTFGDQPICRSGHCGHCAAVCADSTGTTAECPCHWSRVMSLITHDAEGLQTVAAKKSIWYSTTDAWVFCQEFRFRIFDIAEAEACQVIWSALRKLQRRHRLCQHGRRGAAQGASASVFSCRLTLLTRLQSSAVSLRVRGHCTSPPCNVCLEMWWTKRRSWPNSAHKSTTCASRMTLVVMLFAIKQRR